MTPKVDVTNQCVHAKKCRGPMRCMYAGDNACHWCFLATYLAPEGLVGWWVGVWRPYHVERGDLSVCFSAGCDYSLHPNAQDGTLYAIVTVLVLAMWPLISA